MLPSSYFIGSDRGVRHFFGCLAPPVRTVVADVAHCRRGVGHVIFRVPFVRAVRAHINDRRADNFDGCIKGTGR